MISWKPQGFGGSEPTGAWILDSGRFPAPKRQEGALRFSLHGEYQVRFRANTSLPLSQPIGATGDANSTLGQRYYLYHWLRLRPRQPLPIALFLSLPAPMPTAVAM